MVMVAFTYTALPCLLFESNLNVFILCFNSAWFHISALVIGLRFVQNAEWNPMISLFVGMFTHEAKKDTGRVHLSWFTVSRSKISWSWKTNWMIGFGFLCEVAVGEGGVDVDFSKCKNQPLCSDERCCFSSALTAVVLDHDMAATGLFIGFNSWVGSCEYQKVRLLLGTIQVFVSMLTLWCSGFLKEVWWSQGCVNPQQHLPKHSSGFKQSLDAIHDHPEQYGFRLWGWKSCFPATCEDSRYRFLNTK